VRAAYAALVLGVLTGLVLATGVLTGRTGASATVASTLAMDVPGVDLERRRAEAVAVLVARCMSEHGFAWEPWVEPAPVLPDADLDPVAWAERWGFGVSTMVGLPAAALPADPNLVALESASREVREAVHGVLHGSGADRGCIAAATDEVFGLRDRLLAGVRPALVELDQRIAADPAAARVAEVWRSCVAPIADDLARDRVMLAGSLIERASARLAGLGRGPASIAGLAALQADERRRASVLARCEQAFMSERSRFAEAHEAAFVTVHRATLERVGAAIRDAEAAFPTLPPD
jgi:hypothetical protein